jgi:hypothetical protein
MPRSPSRHRRLTLETLCDRRVMENHAPMLNPLVPPSLMSVIEDDPNPPGTLVSDIVGTRITDTDPDAVEGIAVVGLTERIHGTWQYSVDAGSSWADLLEASDPAALVLAADDLVRFLPGLNYSGTPQLTFRGWDQTDGALPGSIVDISSLQGGTGAYSTAFLRANLAVTRANDAPVLDTSTLAQLSDMTEGKTLFGTRIRDFAVGKISDTDAGAVKGIAIVGLTERGPGKGFWQYQLQNDDWTDLPDASDTAALVLTPDDRVRYVGAAFYDGTPKLMFRAWDRTDGVTKGSIVDTTGRQGGYGAYSAEVLSAQQKIISRDSPPVVTMSGTVNYRIGKPAVFIAPNALVRDLDSENLNGKALLVQLHDNNTQNLLAVGAPFVVSSNQVSLNGIVVGELDAFFNGVGGKSLFINFNAAATIPVAQQLVRAITFRTDGGAARSPHIDFNLSGGQAFKFVNIILANRPPVLVNQNVAHAYSLNDSPLAVAPGIALTDSDSAHFGGGALRVRIATPEANNQLLVGTGGNFTLDAENQVLRLGVVIGQRVSDGLGGNELKIKFNTSATPAIVQELMREVAYQNPGNVQGRRTVIFTVSDGDGGINSGVSNEVSQFIDVLSARPVITTSGDAVDYVREAPPVVLAAEATVTDVDSPHFGGGSLTVAVLPGGFHNILAIGGAFNVDSNNVVRLAGVIIGTRTSSGVSTKLRVALSSNATVAIVEELVRSITYQNLDGGSAGERQIAFTLNDGQGGVGIAAKTLNVT